MFPLSTSKVFPVSLEKDNLWIDKDCRVYRYEFGNIMEIAPSAFAVVKLRDNTRCRAYELYLKTFFGEFNAPVNCATHKPEYDLLCAKIEYGPKTVTINDTLFKEIPGYNGYYITENGVVYSRLRNIICKHRIDKDGYHKVDIYPRTGDEIRSKSSVPDIKLVHHLVYKTWVENIEIEDGMCVDHQDSVKWHNYPSNLKYMSTFENTRKAYNDGLCRHSTPFYWTEERLHKACKLMEKGVSIKELAAAFDIVKEREPYIYLKFYSMIRHIKYRSIFKQNKLGWYDIITQYNIDDYYLDPDELFSVKEIKAIKETAEKYRCDSFRPPITGEEYDQVIEEYNLNIPMATIAAKHGASVTMIRRLILKHKNSAA